MNIRWNCHRNAGREETFMVSRKVELQPKNYKHARPLRLASPTSSQRDIGRTSPVARKSKDQSIFYCSVVVVPGEGLSLLVGTMVKLPNDTRGF